MLYDFCISLTNRQKSRILLIFDIACIVFAYFAAHLLVGDLTAGAASPMPMAVDLLILVPVGTAVAAFMGLHALRLNAYDTQGMVETAMVGLIMVGAVVLASFFAPNNSDPVVLIVFGMTFLIAAVTGRLLMRDVLSRIYRNGKQRDRLLIYAAGQTGQQLAAALRTDDAVAPVAFVDDNPTLQSRTLSGLKVYASSQVQDLVQTMGIDRVVLAMPSASRPVQARITRRLREIGCEVQLLPSFADLVAQGDRTTGRRALEVSELLGRNRLDEEIPGVSETYHARTILVTGAGGSIGSELCRQLVTCNPSCLVLMDHSELALYSIQRELSELAPRLKIMPVLGSICEESLVRDVLTRFGIEVILHAAAYKHLPMVEENCIEGMRNNVLGTKVVAEAARDAQVERFILVSSDKAVRPTSAMGSSKRLAELVVQDLATRSTATRFSMVRFGNVLGSSGSVIPLFEEQIERGGPVTLTHSDVTRYFMTVSEAVRLVLLAGSFARGGDVFVLDMGEPVPVRQLALQMIEGAGLSVRDEHNPGGDIEIQITGLRPGEKLHEELLIGSDMLTTPHPKILRAQEGHLSELEMAKVTRSLRDAIAQRDEAAVTDIIAQWIEKGGADPATAINQV